MGMMTSLDLYRRRRGPSGPDRIRVGGRPRRPGAVRYGVALLALGCLLVPGMAAQGTAEASVATAHRAGVVPQAQPLPVAGGMQIPGGPFIHVFGPGPEGQ